MNATLSSKPEAPTVRKGFPGIRCPLCGSDDVQTISLDDLETCHCAGCEEDYTLDDVRQLVAAWGKVLAWVESAPMIAE